MRLTDMDLDAAERISVRPDDYLSSQVVAALRYAVAEARAAKCNLVQAGEALSAARAAARDYEDKLSKSEAETDDVLERLNLARADLERYRERKVWPGGLAYSDACEISRVWNEHTDMNLDDHFRVNRWLHTLIGLLNPNHPTADQSAAKKSLGGEQ